MSGTRRNQVRVIGGRWRGRKLDFPTVPGLRPTPDRVRETVFNWLQPVIAGAACLDLCAGTGSFGIEAVSRGAARALLVEQDARAAAAIQAMVTRLQAPEIQLLRSDALGYLRQAPEYRQAWNIVFLDPPYASRLLPACLDQLCQAGWLAPGALVYFEMPAQENLPPMPPCLQLLKEKRAGQVAYFLARHGSAP